MKNIFVIAKMTFQETLRDRILYGLLAFGILFILLDIFLAKLALGDLVMIRSFGLAGIYLFSLTIMIFLGASIIYREIERRTLYFVLAKPVQRNEVILGKFFGLLAAVTATIMLMSIVYFGIVAFEGGGFDRLGLLALAFQLLETALLVSLLVFLSTIATPLTATISTVLMIFVGHYMTTALVNARLIGGLMAKIVDALYYILPNLEKFNVRNLVVHDMAPTIAATVLTIGYTILYSAVLLSLAIYFFNKKEL